MKEAWYVPANYLSTFWEDEKRGCSTYEQNGIRKEIMCLMCTWYCSVGQCQREDVGEGRFI